MTARPTDDELRAMLERRAGAVSPAAAREALAGARAEIAGPVTRDGAGVAFGVRRVATTRRRSRMSWSLAGLAVAAVIVAAVLGGRAQLERPVPTPVAAGSSPQAVAGGSPAPIPSNLVLAPGPITAEELGNRLRTGELDGKMVVVQGRLTLAMGRCLAPEESGPAADCTFVQIDGLPDIFIDKGDRTEGDTQASIDRFGQSAPVVLRGGGYGLQLVGWLVDAGNGPIQPGSLAAQQVPQDGVVSVIAWLQPGASGTRRLTNPLPDKGLGVTVRVDPAVDLDGASSTLGTFLVGPSPARIGSPTAWDLLGRLDPETTVYVVPPSASLDEPTIAAADLEEALKDRSLDGQVLAIDGTLEAAATSCPAYAQAPCAHFVVDALPDVAITWDGALTGVDGASGRILVTPRDGHLDLLGVLDGDLSRPIGVSDLTASQRLGRPWDPLQVDAVDGWLAPGLPVFCPLMRPGADVASVCPLSLPLLTTSEPVETPQGTPADGLRVTVDRDGPGISDAPTPTPGPFLIRQIVAGNTCSRAPRDPSRIVCEGAPVYGWQVVARYDPEQVRVVTIP